MSGELVSFTKEVIGLVAALVTLYVAVRQTTPHGRPEDHSRRVAARAIGVPWSRVPSLLAMAFGFLGASLLPEQQVRREATFVVGVFCAVVAYALSGYPKARFIWCFFASIFFGFWSYSLTPMSETAATYCLFAGAVSAIVEIIRQTNAERRLEGKPLSQADSQGGAEGASRPMSAADSRDARPN